MIKFLINNQTAILGILFFISEIMAKYPIFKSNGIFHLIYNLLAATENKPKLPDSEVKP